MKKQLTMALAASALVVAMLPAVAQGAYDRPGEPNGYAAKYVCQGYGVVGVSGNRQGWPAPSDWREDFVTGLSEWATELSTDCRLAGPIPIRGG